MVFMCIRLVPVFRLKRTFTVYSTVMASNRGVVLGFFEATSDKEIQLTDATKEVNEKTSSKLLQLIKKSNLGSKKGKSRVFYGLHDDYPAIAVVSLGKKGVGYNPLEEVEEGKENIRSAVATGVRSLNEAGFNDIRVDPCSDAQAAAEAATLCTYVYDELKAEKKPAPKVQCFLENSCSHWKRGTILAEAQNFARRLMETPANVMTPTRMSELAKEYIGTLKNVTVQVHDREWAESHKMGSYLSVTNGSAQPPKFIEIEYKGGKEGEQCVALVGKGITFDAGGISLKPPPNMDAMRADMGGAACVLASVYAAARLEIPINVRVFTPCCENLPSGTATKPGDVVRAMNGKTIQVDNTDAEGRLVLADALCYAQTYKPKAIVDMATLTGAMMIALGAGAAGVFTNSDDLWNRMHEAGKSTGDRVWRMPLFNLYKKQINDCQLADVNNIGSAGRNAGSCTAAAFLKAGKQTGDRVWRMPLWRCFTETMRDSQLADLLNSTVSTGVKGGGSCLAAAFLKEFVDHDNWMHMDIAGVMSNKGEVSYLTKGMAGRPTRTVVEFLQSMAGSK